MDRHLFIIFLSGLILSCSDNKQTTSFSTADPKKDALRINKIQKLYYVVDSISIDTVTFGHFYKIGDTLLMNKFDSAGNLTNSRTYKAFSVVTNYRYDENGFIKHKRVFSDFSSEWYVCTFIDTTKRIGYQKWFDQLSDAAPTIFYYNKNGLTDSMVSSLYSQSPPIRFKEYFFYNNNILTMTVKKTFAADTIKARQAMKMLVDTTEYFYNQSKLTKIKQTIILPLGQFNTLTEFFDKNERPYKTETLTGKGFFIRQHVINTP